MDALPRPRPLFDHLPDFAIISILKLCDGKDIAKARMACKRLNLLGKLPTVWRSCLYRKFGINVSGFHAQHYSSLCGLYRCLIDPEMMDARLCFRGVLTDGGMQDDDPQFWIDNMFHTKLSSVYSSSLLDDKAIHCVGMYNTTRGSKPSLISFTQKVGQGLKDGGVTRKLMYNRRMIKTLMDGSSPDPPLVLIRQMQISRTCCLACPVSSGVVLLGNLGVSNAHSLGENDFISKLYGMTMGPCQQALSECKKLADVLIACKSSKIGVPSLVGRGRNGEWVEFERKEWEDVEEKVIPSVWFRFYSREEYLGGPTQQRDEEWQWLKDEFCSMGAKCITTRRSKLLSNSDDYHNNAEDCESDGDASSTGGTHTRSKMIIPLRRPVVANLACVMLNSCEVFMNEFCDLYGGPNIEINSACFWGREIKPWPSG